MATINPPLKQTSGQATDRASGDANWQLFWCLLLVVSAPMMVLYLAHLWQIESYRFFPFAFLASGWLFYQRWDRQFRAPRGVLTWLIILSGLLCVLIGISLPTKWIAAVGFVTLLAAFLYSVRGQQDRNLVALVLPLLLTIRLPLGYDRLLVIELQRITTSLSSVLLDCLSIPHAVANNSIRLVDRELFVAETCSGIQSVFTLAFLSILMVVGFRRRIWLTPLYLAIAIVLAIAANILRVTSVVAGHAWWEVDLATGWPHEMIGYVALLLGAALLLSFDQLIIGVLHPMDPPDDDRAGANPLVELWNFLVDEPSTQSSAKVETGSGKENLMINLWKRAWPRRLFIATALVLALGSFAQAINMQRPQSTAKPTALVFAPPADIFDHRFETIEVISHESMRGNSDPRLGENADIWNCRIEGTDIESQFVLSQPYHGWHELCICYEGSNWLVLNREVRGSKDGSTPEQPYQPLAVARFKQDNGAYAYLFYSGFDPSGDVLSPPARPGRLGTRLRDLLYEGDQFERANVMMLQLFVVVPNRLDLTLLESLTDDFVQMREVLLDELKGKADNTVTASTLAVPPGKHTDFNVVSTAK